MGKGVVLVRKEKNPFSRVVCSGDDLSTQCEFHIESLFYAGISRLRLLLGCPELLSEGEEEAEVVHAGAGRGYNCINQYGRAWQGLSSLFTMLFMVY